MPVYKNPPGTVREKVEDEAESPEQKIVKHYHEQCLMIKQDIYKVMERLHKGLDEKSSEYISAAKSAQINLAEAILEANKLIKVLRSSVENAKDELHQEADNLVKQRLCEQKDFDKLLKRMGELEAYLKDERFHSLVKEINALEEKFEKEAMKLVQKRMGSKDL